MYILITGGTGLIGRALCQHWSILGHQVRVLSRTPEEVARRCGAQIKGVSSIDAVADEPLDAVVNLAGAPIADRPWTKARRQFLWESRVTLTEQLVEGLARRAQKPAVLISGSAVGWYGDTGERLVTEEQPAGTDFASELCGAWEDAAGAAAELGIRVVLVRTGLVLAGQGGFLSKLLPAFRFGLGGPLGNGKQWMPWIHLADQVALIDFLLQNPGASGPYNACSPHPVRNREFTQALGKVLHRPAILPVPALALKWGLGELSGLLLGGQQAVPKRLQAAGFTFRFPELGLALDDLLSRPQ